MSKILIACGGTGGHVFPAKALAEAIQENYPDAEILFAGVFKPHLERALTLAGYKILQAAGKAMPYRFDILAVPFLINISSSLKNAFSILTQHHPDIVVSMGSFSGGPFVIAGKLKSLPVLIHEQNVAPGRANRLSAYFADRIATSFEATADFFPRSVRQKIVCTGNPVRREILEVGTGPHKFTILVMGGSQGSHAINMVFIEAVKRLDKDRFEILHLAGKDDCEILSKEYKNLGIENKIFTFVEDMASVYRTADLAVCRAGAVTVSEITALGIASILVPYPYGDRHQSENANVLKNAGAAVVIEERDLTKEKLAAEINQILQNPARLGQMRKASRSLAMPDAAHKLAKEVMGLVG